MILITLTFILYHIENWGEIARFCFYRSLKESYNPLYLIYQEKRNYERNHSSVFLMTSSKRILRALISTIIFPKQDIKMWTNLECYYFIEKK